MRYFFNGGENVMKRILIKGSCKEIDRNINYILTLEKQSYNLVKIVGIICYDREYDSIEGIPCVKNDFDDFDYVIVLRERIRLKQQLKIHISNTISEKIVEPMKKLVGLALINKNKNWTKANKIIDKIYSEDNITSSKTVINDCVIYSEILYTPGFDFKRYIELRETGVSILSNNCWGGLAYHYLGIPIRTPFINMWMLPDDYFRLVNNLEYYLNQKLTIVGSSYDKGRRRWYPVVALGDVKMHWNHCFNKKHLEKSVEQFIRRSKRVDYDRLLAFVYFEGAGLAEKYANEFEAIPINNKIGISHDYSGKNIYLAMDYNKDKGLYGNDFFKYVNGTVRRDYYSIIKPFDMFKLLNLENDFCRLL